jgi:nucleoid DNA-binding protein
MNKAELIEEVANQTGLAKRTSGKAVDAVVSAISDCLTRGEKVTLVGFGTLRVTKKKARVGRNPQTGESINIPAKKVPKFVPSKNLKNKVK